MKNCTASRRKFLQSAAAASTVYSLVPHTVLGANERINIGMIGLGSMGGGHYKGLSAMEGCRVTAVSDADSERMGKAEGAVCHQDFRRLLAMRDVDAVFVSTPNHWHSLAAIMAMQAGKHVYVEKPVSHCIWEGRRMVEAARKYRRICQAGTQQSSCPAVHEVARDVRSGLYGRVLWAHTSRLGARKPIGKVGAPLSAPASVDYNLWAGPAPMDPVRREKFHYDWHWQFAWGDGEMGNWAIHFLNDLRMILGWDDVPGNVIAVGNRFWDDDGETPNMHFALMEHRGVQVVVDVRNMPGKRGGDGGAVYLGARDGNYIMCEKGWIRISRGGGAGYDSDGKRIAQYKGDGGKDHKKNFLDAIRAGDPAVLNADIETGHQSTVMCHLANIAWRVGAESSVDDIREWLKGSEDALNTLTSMADQLEFNGVDLKKTPFIAGPGLTYDNRAEVFAGPCAAQANALVRLPGRAGFVVPDQV
jgi:predicted dehydrogenase